MATTPYTPTIAGFITDDTGDFEAPSGFGTLNSGIQANYIILQYTPATDSNIYWIDASTGPNQESNLALTHLAATTGAPFDLYAAVRIDGARSDFPVGDTVLPALWRLRSLGGADHFQHPKISEVGSSVGLFVGRVRVAANPGIGQVTVVPVNVSSFIPAMTDQSWSRKLYISIWANPLSGSLVTANINLSTLTLNLPGLTQSATNRDTGRSGNAKADSPYQRCPVTGLAILGERMVADGYREGALVHPHSWDPPEPEPRPDPGETDWERLP